jgi:hypothetical protein
MLRQLYVHDSFGSPAGAEANLLITATELKTRGASVGLWSPPAPDAAVNQSLIAQRLTHAFNPASLPAAGRTVASSLIKLFLLQTAP